MSPWYALALLTAWFASLATASPALAAAFLLPLTLAILAELVKVWPRNPPKLPAPPAGRVVRMTLDRVG
jgi:hypothetical protein